MLESHGYKVINVSIGPISSNWDRAIEVYYQLKGGQADYGLSHSEKYGLIQKPHDKKVANVKLESEKGNTVLYANPIGVT